jgi:hypothetical protein
MAEPVGLKGPSNLRLESACVVTDANRRSNSLHWKLKLYVRMVFWNLFEKNSFFSATDDTFQTICANFRQITKCSVNRNPEGTRFWFCRLQW